MVLGLNLKFFKIKKLLFGLIATVMLSISSFGQTLEESAVIITGSRVHLKDAEQSARSFTIKSFDRFVPLSQYSIDNVGFTDDGKYNDSKAGDGIYTSTKLFPNLEKENLSNKMFVSDLFKYTSQLSSSSSKFAMSCKMRITHSGSSWFGNSCQGGCIELYDCEVSISW